MINVSEVSSEFR